MAHEILWTHPSPSSTNLHKFIQFVNRKYNLSISSYSHLHQWSITNSGQFWSDAETFVGVDWDQQYHTAIDPSLPLFPPQVSFAGSKLNFAKNLLFPKIIGTIDQTKPAIIAVTENGQNSLSWEQLRQQVATCQRSMIAVGLQSGDRVGGFIGNHASAVVAMLAATSLGAIWTAVSPDTGVFGVVERMKQISPVMLVTDNGSAYNGKTFSMKDKVEQVLSQLPSLRTVVVVATVSTFDTELNVPTDRMTVYSWSQFTEEQEGVSGEDDLKFVPHPPDHPVYILYSSGTTGAPKCIVHGAAGTLVQHKKEHVIHCDIGPQSIVFYYTTTTWMMWHWLVSALASGATIVLYDGSPFVRNGMVDHYAMPHLISELGVTHFGTSAKYLSVLEQKGEVLPGDLDTSSLQALYSTGSPLAPSTSRFIYSKSSPFPQTVQLSSITGGTDIISLFGGPCAFRPVQPGLIQCPGLGMAIRSFDEDGNDVTSQGTEGDLVCISPFISQPVGFWGVNTNIEGADAGAHLQAGLSKYEDAYFTKFGPRIWHHGDHIRFIPQKEVNVTSETAETAETSVAVTADIKPTPDPDHSLSAPFVILGRSDGVLKPAGVRFGSAELYNVVLANFGSRVSDAVAIGWRASPEDADEQVVMFLKLSESELFNRRRQGQQAQEHQSSSLSEKDNNQTMSHCTVDDLHKLIKTSIRTSLSARHVPSLMAECDDVPVTPNGKKMEVLVRKLTEGKVKVADVSKSVANPECLQWFVDWAVDQRRKIEAVTVAGSV